MADTTASANMNLPVPTVGVDAGPDWATNLNSCLTIIDQHDHSSGNGVPVNPAGLNINGDLPINNNNLLSIKSAQLQTQASPLSGSTYLGVIYRSGVDLYYNDGAGNQIQITQSGGVAGTPGSIANLVSPASASYVSGSATFVWQSDTSTPANMDGASYLLRNLTANSKALTLSPPNAMGADYSLILPALPAQQNIMTLDASGNIGAAWNVDNSTIEVSSNTIQVKDNGITDAKIAPATITADRHAPLNQRQAASSGNFFTSSASLVEVDNQNVLFQNIGGRPNMIMLGPDGTGNAGYLASQASSDKTTFSEFTLMRGSSEVGTILVGWQDPGGSNSNYKILSPVGQCFIDPVGAPGLYRYILKARYAGGSAGTAFVHNIIMTVFEIY